MVDREKCGSIICGQCGEWMGEVTTDPVMCSGHFKLRIMDILNK